MSSQTLSNPAPAPTLLMPVPLPRSGRPRVDIIDFGVPIERPHRREPAMRALPLTQMPPFAPPPPLRLVPPPMVRRANAATSVRAFDASPLKLTRRGRVALVFVAFLFMLLGFSLGNDVSLASPAPATPVIPVGAHTIVVQPGDTLWAIASNIAPKADPRVTVQRIISLNKLPNAELAAGELLALPS